MRAIKITLVLVATVIVVAVTTLMAGVPARFLLAPVADQVESATGFRLDAGNLKLGLWPNPTAELRDITLTEAHPSGPQTSIAAESLRAEITLASLFTGKPEVSEITLVRPVITSPLVRERRARAAFRPSSPSAARTADVPVRIAKVAIVDGTVMFVSDRGRAESRIDHINVTAVFAADKALDVEASADTGGQKLRLALKGKLPSDGANAVPVTFAFEAPGMLQGAVAGTADLRQTGKLMRINSVSGTIGTSKFSGWASVDFAAGKPFVKLDLDVQRLDLAAITVAASPPAAASVEAVTDWDAPWSDAKIDLDGLNFVDAELQFSAGEFNIDRFKLAPVVLGGTLEAGVLNLNVSRMGMHGGQVNGTIQVDASSAEPAQAMQISISGVRAYGLLSDVAQFSAIDGRMEANIDLRSRGASARSVMSSFAGTIAVTFQDGVLRTLDIPKMVRDLGVGAIAGWQDNKTGGTEFTEISALFRVDAGRATTTNLRMAGPLVRVSGSGTADLGAKTLQFRLDPKLVLTLQGQGGATDPVGLGVPVVVQGTWGKPDIYPDIAGVFDNPGAAFAKIREMAPGLFGGSGSSQAGAGGNDLMQGIGGILERLGGQQGGAGRPGGQQGSGNVLREFFGR